MPEKNLWELINNEKNYNISILVLCRPKNPPPPSPAVAHGDHASIRPWPSVVLALSPITRFLQSVQCTQDVPWLPKLSTMRFPTPKIFRFWMGNDINLHDTRYTYTHRHTILYILNDVIREGETLNMTLGRGLSLFVY